MGGQISCLQSPGCAEEQWKGSVKATVLFAFGLQMWTSVSKGLLSCMIVVIGFVGLNNFSIGSVLAGEHL